MNQNKNDTEKLRTVVEQMHGGIAHHLRQVQITEKFEGQTAWYGVVHIFTLKGHARADTCYAWSSVVEGSDKRRFYAVLKIPPVDSPQPAVRAAIVADHKAGRSA